MKRVKITLKKSSLLGGYFDEENTYKEPKTEINFFEKLISSYEDIIITEVIFKNKKEKEQWILQQV